jgi:micrococcal nuclease
LLVQVIGGSRKRASQQGALFVCLLLCCALGLALGMGQAAAQTCTTDRVDEIAVVEKVHDGDTLRLQGGRSVRLIGINSPELAYDNKPAEPFAEQARDALRALLKPKDKVKLVYGREKHDRYRRLLAHVYLENGESVEAHLLEAGLAAQIVVPPNVAQLDCYHAAELRARQDAKGVWSSIYQPVPIEKLPRDTRGFRLVSGRITRVGNSKKSVWLNFAGPASEGYRELVAARIARKDLAKFPDWKPQSLLGKNVIVRGWVYKHKHQLVIRVRHPAGIELLQ